MKKIRYKLMKIILNLHLMKKISFKLMKIILNSLYKNLILNFNLPKVLEIL